MDETRKSFLFSFPRIPINLIPLRKHCWSKKSFFLWHGFSLVLKISVDLPLCLPVHTWPIVPFKLGLEAADLRLFIYKVLV